MTHPKYDSSGVTYFYCVYVCVREGVWVIRSMTHPVSRVSIVCTCVCVRVYDISGVWLIASHVLCSTYHVSGVLGVLSQILGSDVSGYPGWCAWMHGSGIFRILYSVSKWGEFPGCRIQVIFGISVDLSICVALARTGETARSKVWKPLCNIPPPLKITWSLLSRQVSHV